MCRLRQKTAGLERYMGHNTERTAEQYCRTMSDGHVASCVQTCVCKSTGKRSKAHRDSYMFIRLGANMGVNCVDNARITQS